MSKKVSKIFLVYYSSFTTKSGSNVHILELLKNLQKYADVALFAPGQNGIERDYYGIK